MLELNLNLLAEIGGWAALKEARALVARGRVSEARREGAVIRARVQGAEKVHEPQITLADRVADVEVRCSCAEYRKTGRVCPHVLAAGVALLQPAKAAPRDRPTQGPAPATTARLPKPDLNPARTEVRIDGALAGLTLEIVAAGKEAVAEIEAIGFRRVRQGMSVFGLQKENNVAHFLANTLPRWRQMWTVTLGPRLEATLAEVDIAQPEFSLRAGSGEDWLSLDLKLSVGGKAVELDGGNSAVVADGAVAYADGEQAGAVGADGGVARDEGGAGRLRGGAGAGRKGFHRADVCTVPRRCIEGARIFGGRKCGGGFVPAGR